jgi:hypothetical protein
MRQTENMIFDSRSHQIGSQLQSKIVFYYIVDRSTNTFQLDQLQYLVTYPVNGKSIVNARWCKVLFDHGKSQ